MLGLAGSGAYIYAKRVKLAYYEGLELPMLDYLGRWKWPSVALVTVVPGVAYLFW